MKAADRNPHSRNMEFYENLDGSGHEGRFTKCAICTHGAKAAFRLV